MAAFSLHGVIAMITAVFLCVLPIHAIALPGPDIDTANNSPDDWYGKTPEEGTFFIAGKSVEELGMHWKEVNNVWIPVPPNFSDKDADILFFDDTTNVLESQNHPSPKCLWPLHTVREAKNKCYAYLLINFREVWDIDSVTDICTYTSPSRQDTVTIKGLLDEKAAGRDNATVSAKGGEIIEHFDFITKSCKPCDHQINGCWIGNSLQAGNTSMKVRFDVTTDRKVRVGPNVASPELESRSEEAETDDKSSSDYDLNVVGLNNAEDSNLLELTPPTHSLPPVHEELAPIDSILGKRQMEDTDAYSLNCSTILGDPKLEGLDECERYINSYLDYDWSPRDSKKWHTVCRVSDPENREIFHLQISASKCHGPVTGAAIVWIPKQIAHVCGTCEQGNCPLAGLYRTKGRYPLWARMSASGQLIPGEEVAKQPEPLPLRFSNVENDEECHAGSSD